MSHWCRSAEEAAAKAEKASEAGWNVYWGTGLRGADLGARRRGEKQAVTGLVCLWEDVDYGTAGHKAPNLPPTETDALSLIRELPIRPTLIVHSGHGLQAAWVLKEPWVFDRPDEWRQAERLCRRWSATLRGLARPRGWVVDSTWSIEHVMRVPGTWNRKPGEEPVRARILVNGGPVVCPSDIDEIAVEVADEDPFEELPAGTLRLSPKAEPPWRKFYALQANDPKFKASIERKRRDLEDSSTSGHDMAAASIMALAGFDEQEIADTLVFNRVERGEDSRLDNESYYRLTVTKAKARTQTAGAVAAIEDWYAGEIGQESEGDKKSKLRELIQGGLLVEVTRIRKLLGEPPEYILETPQGDVKLGTVDGLISQSKLRSAVASVTGRYVPVFKADRWKILAQALLDLCEEDDAGPEAFDRGMVAGWIARYLEDAVVGEFNGSTLKNRQPFTRGGRTFLFLTHFRSWLLRRDGERISSKEIGKMLRRFGVCGEVVGCEIDGKVTTRYVWGLPVEE